MSPGPTKKAQAHRLCRRQQNDAFALSTGNRYTPVHHEATLPGSLEVVIAALGSYIITSTDCALPLYAPMGRSPLVSSAILTKHRQTSTCDEEIVGCAPVPTSTVRLGEDRLRAAMESRRVDKTGPSKASPPFTWHANILYPTLHISVCQQKIVTFTGGSKTSSHWQITSMKHVLGSEERYILPL